MSRNIPGEDFQTPAADSQVPPRRPLPHEHREIARGSGAAAILLFLHIATIGYLLFITWFLISGNKQVFWNLLPLRSGLVFYFPAAFAVMTYLPTDALTRVVARISVLCGLITTLLYGSGLAIQWIEKTGGVKPGYDTLIAIAGGLVGGMAMRGIFYYLTADRRQNYEKVREERLAPE